MDNEGRAYNVSNMFEKFCSNIYEMELFLFVMNIYILSLHWVNF